jgi:hypothetical protein
MRGCYDQREIAKVCGCDQTTVLREIDRLMHLVSENQNHKSAASHATDFDPPLYNVWKQQDKTSGGAGNLGMRPRHGDLGIRPPALFSGCTAHVALHDDSGGYRARSVGAVCPVFRY